MFESVTGVLIAIDTSLWKKNGLNCAVFSTRHDGEARFNDEISELKKELAERDETISKLEKTISACEEV